MIEEQDERNMRGINAMEEEEEIDISKQDFSHIQKHPYINKVFCWIQSGQTSEVIRFFDTFPHLLKNFTSPNNWNPILFAVRYGNTELIDYFNSKNIEINPTGILTTVSIVHTAIYSGQSSTLQYVVNNLGVPVNPKNCEISPLKSAMKANNPRMVEFLVSRGAYYVFGDVYNNLELKQNIEEQNKYQTLASKEQEAKDIAQTLVVEESTVRDCPIKETLRYARVKPIIYLKQCASKYKSEISKKDEDDPFSSLAEILADQNYLNLMLKVAANKGDSIFQRNTGETSQDI